MGYWNCSTGGCNFGPQVVFVLQVNKRNYNAGRQLPGLEPASKFDYNPGGAIATGGNALPAFQLFWYSGDAPFLCFISDAPGLVIFDSVDDDAMSLRLQMSNILSGWYFHCQ